MVQGITFVVLVLFVAFPARPEYTLSDFKTQLFKFSYPDDGIRLFFQFRINICVGLYNIDLGFGDDDIQPLAFGDLNGDK